MFERVIVGIDPARVDRDAIALARAVAPGASLDLVSAFPDSDLPARDRRDDVYRTLLRDGATGRLVQTRAEAGLPDAQIHAIASYNPAKALRHHAAETHADLIVLGAPEERGLGHAMLGDVARGVLHGAPCPVLDVAGAQGSGGAPLKRIGVAYDRSPEAVRALNVAVDIALDVGAEIELVEALGLSPGPVVWGPDLVEYLDGLAGPENERLHKLAASLEVPATGKAVRGTPANVLRDLAERVDLMVCGSRSWGTAGRIAFGSTADRLLHEAPCAVLVVPRGAAELEPEAVPGSVGAGTA